MSTPETPPPTGGDRVAALEAELARQATELHKLGEALTELLRRSAAAEVQSWLTVDDPTTAQAMLAELDQWVGEVWGHYPGLTPRLPHCWPLHPWVVEELWVSMQMWQSAARKPGDYRVRDAWHERSRPGVVRRIDASPDGDAHCEPSQHLPNPAPGWPVDVPALDDIAAQWATTRTLPVPTVRTMT